MRLLSLKSFTSISISYDSSILTSSSIYFFAALLYTSFREMAKKIVITNVKAPTPKNMYYMGMSFYNRTPPLYAAMLAKEFAMLPIPAYKLKLLLST